MNVDQAALIKYQYLINYRKIILLKNELSRLIWENKYYLDFDDKFNETEFHVAFTEGSAGDEFLSIKNYVDFATIINKSLDLFEQSGKAIMVFNGLTWSDCKKLGHNILDIYSVFPKNVKDEILHELINLHEISDEKEFFDTLTKYTYTRDVDGNITKLLANIKTRYPGESLSPIEKKSLKTICRISFQLCDIYERYMPEDIKNLYAFDVDPVNLNKHLDSETQKL